MSGQPSARDAWARHHVYEALRHTHNQIAFSPEPSPFLRLDSPIADHEDLPPPPPLKLPVDAPTEAPVKVCIIGAGAAGLFTAMLFDYLNEHVKGFNVEYDIFESNDTVGGRLFTYKFSEKPHDYYDVGAMRFPNNEIMKRMLRTFCTFDYLGMKMMPYDKEHRDPPLGSIIPYFIKGNNEPWCFNNINQMGSYKGFATNALNNDPFQINWDPSAPIPPDAMKIAAAGSPEDVIAASITPYVKALEADPVGGWKLLMTIDKLSTTEFLATKPTLQDPKAPILPPYNYNTIEWLETFGGGTNWYDQAHSETVLEYMDFNSPDTKGWYCIMGGANQLTLFMRKKLKHPEKIKYNTRVKGIDVSLRDDAKVKIGDSWANGYVGVFNSTTMGSMQQMDLTKANLNYGQKQAIRSLGYGASAKVGMKFTEPWWIKEFGIDSGGLGHSDLSIRTTVYPSYNIHDGENETSVLLSSYEWQQDAQRISTLISGHKDHQKALTDEEALRERVLQDLASLHANQPQKPMSQQEVYNMIKPMCLDHYAHDWYHDDNTYGAFAFFRPQQFGSMWPYIIAPSPSLVMIGEHASNHHAWVVGALESAVHGVHGWLSQNTFHGAKEAAQMMESWKEITSENPFGQLPPFVTSEQRQWQQNFGLFREERFRTHLETHRKHHAGHTVALTAAK